MQNINLTKKEGEAVVRAQRELYTALLGTVNFARNLSILLVCFSILMATFFLHEGWFPTSKSSGMTNYHRWLYDQYVICSCLITPIVYLRFKQQQTNRVFRRKWNAYIHAYAQYNLKLKKVIQRDEGDRSAQQHLSNSMTSHILRNKWVQYVTLILIIYGSIAMYVWMTPFVSTRGSSFWILTWWPINALMISVLYYIQFPLLLRLFSNAEIHRQDRRLLRKTACQQELQ